MPFLAIVLLAAISLAFAPSSYWDKMIIGDQWLECLLSIPIIATVPFAITIWAVRRAAPTDLARTGAFAGLIAGGVSAMAYALHCMDDSLPFVAVWYGGTIALCTFAGAILGPRLLRWCCWARPGDILPRFLYIPLTCLTDEAARQPEVGLRGSISWH